MKFLSEILKRPPNEKPSLIIPIGYPAEGCRVPDLQRKSLDEVAVFLEPPQTNPPLSLREAPPFKSVSPASGGRRGKSRL